MTTVSSIGNITLPKQPDFVEQASKNQNIFRSTMNPAQVLNEAKQDVFQLKPTTPPATHPKYSLDAILKRKARTEAKAEVSNPILAANDKLQAAYRNLVRKNNEFAASKKHNLSQEITEAATESAKKAAQEATNASDALQNTAKAGLKEKLTNGIKNTVKDENKEQVKGFFTRIGQSIKNHPWITAAIVLAAGTAGYYTTKTYNEKKAEKLNEAA